MTQVHFGVCEMGLLGPKCLILWQGRWRRQEKCSRSLPGPSKKCYRRGDRLSYIGTVNVTYRGRPCLLWDEQSQYESWQFPDESVRDAKNYCRNPDNSPQPWCHRRGRRRVRRNRCTIPLCDESTDGVNEREWMGEWHVHRLHAGQLSDEIGLHSCVSTNRHKAVLFPWLVPPEEPQIINSFLHNPCYCGPKRHH